MKNYISLFFLLVSVFCFGQLEPISTFENEELLSYRFNMFPISDQFGNNIIVHSNGDLHLMLLDENFQLIKKKRLEFVLQVISNERCSYFQNKEKVFGVYRRKRGKAPKIISINKEDFKVEVEDVNILKSDKVFSFFEDNGYFYYVTSGKGTKDISIYKFLEFELVKKVTFKGSGKHQFTKWDKEYVSSFENEKLFFENNERKMFFQNEKLFFIKSSYNEPIISTRILEFDFNNEQTFSRVLKFEHDSHNNSKSKKRYEGAKRISVHILENKLFQCARIKNNFYLNIFDLATGELHVNEALGDMLRGSRIDEVKISNGEPTFTGLFLNAKKSGSQTLMDWNFSNISTSTTGIGIRKLSNGNLVVVFGKNKKLTKNGGYSPGFPGDDYAPATPGTFYGRGSAENRTHFGYFLMDEDGKILPNESANLSRFTFFKKHLASLREEQKKKAKHLEKRIFQSSDGFHMITYDPYESTFEIF